MATDTSTSKTKWTESQQAAIRITDKTLLVSAAAGSGKTATLTERIIRSITSGGADISKMLIVTYTRAAAAELRSRIFSALSNALADDPSNTALNEQLIKLGSANICTIDSFYFNLVRQNFSSLGISATRRIGDTAELELLKTSLAEEVIDEFYESRADFPSLVDCFVRVKSINTLTEHILRIYDDISAFPRGLNFLKSNADELRICAIGGGDLMCTKYGDILRAELKKKLQHYYSILDDAYNITLSEYSEFLSKRADVYAYDRSTISLLLQTLDEGTYEDVCSVLRNYAPLRMYTTKKFEEDETTLFFKDQRDVIKKALVEFKNEIFSRDPESMCRELNRTADISEMLYDLLTVFEEKYDEEKVKRNIMDFNQVRRLAHGLLVDEYGHPTEHALAYRERFTHIYIDEYQDVDRVQDEIFSSISNNNRFMVGDIKQSIYGFRNADPDVFAEYKNALPLYDAQSPNDNDLDALSIFMSDNFRCDKPVIDFTNLVCGRLFSASAESIGYTSADDLNYSKKQNNVYAGYASDKVKVAVILTKNEDNEGYSSDEGDEPKRKNKKKKDPDAPDAEELEAEYIAARINELVGKEKRADGKIIKPGDIAILYRSGKMVSYLVEALGKYGIRCSEGGGDSYFENPDVLLVLSLLNVVDNPHRDIHLAGVLCSPLYDFSLEQLITVRSSADRAYSLYDALLMYAESGKDALAEKCRLFKDELDKLRTSSIALPVDRFLRLLFESDIFVASGLLSDRDSYGDGGNLLRLYDYARSFESGSFRGLYNFIEFINSLIENDKKLEVAKKAPNDNIVTLSTMHHSKGLEFPVCFICGTGAGKNMKGLYASMLYDKNTGLAMKLPDPTGFARVNTPMREAIFMGKYLREIEEEMRILYVAMTRAREKLYITATKNATEEELMQSAYMQNRYPSAYSINSCRSFLEWLLIPFADENARIDCAELMFVSPEDIADDLDVAEYETEDNQAVGTDQELYESLVKDMSFVYPYSHLHNLPSKLSVSRLYPDMLDSDDGSAELSRGTERAVIPDFFISGQSGRVTAAERGTATHLFFQFCDFSRAENEGSAEELARLVNEGFINKDIAELVYRDELDSFLHSELMKKIFAAKEIVRERRFNLLLPADAFALDSDVSESYKGEYLAVQGVIDLILIDENGDIELYDYKTDRLTRDEIYDYGAAKTRLNADHSLQLSYYAYAIEAMFERKCKRVCVYSTHSARLYDIDRVPLKLK